MTDQSKRFPKLEDFGVDPKTVSRWRSRLKDRNAFRSALFGAAYKKAMAEKVGLKCLKGGGVSRHPRVLKALATNALHACEEVAVAVAPEITIWVDNDGITITDNGPGIPAETVIEPTGVGPLGRGARLRPGARRRAGVR